MKVKAPAEKNFKRAKVQARTREAVALARRLEGRAARRGARCSSAMRATEPSNWSSAPRRSRSGGSSSPATCGCPARKCEALAHGLYGRSILTADLDACRRHLLESPWVADAALRRVLPSTIEVRVVERQPIGHQPAGKPAVSDRSVGHGDRRVRSAVPRVRSADHRRARPVAEEGQAGDRRASAPSWRRACIDSVSHAQAIATTALADRRLRPARRRRAARRRLGAAASRRGAVRRAPAVVPRGRLGAARSGGGHRLRRLAVRRSRVRRSRAARPGTVEAAADRRRLAQRSEGGSVARKERYLVGLDVGTSKITAIVGEMTDDGGLDIIGMGLADSQGDPPGRRGEPRGGGRIDQEGDRRSGADRRGRDRFGPPRAVRART